MVRFGINATEVDSAASMLGRVLGVAFHRHESESRGGRYCRAEVKDGVIIIQCNRDLYDDEAVAPEWPIDKLLLLMDGATEASWRPYIEALSKLDETQIVYLR